MTTERFAFVPAWAPHIEGYYFARPINEDGQPEEAEVGAKCTVCGESFKKMCLSGLMRQHIAVFARVHLHRDPLQVKR